MSTKELEKLGFRQDLEKYYTVCSSYEESKNIIKLFKEENIQCDTRLSFTGNWNIVVFNQQEWWINHNESFGKQKLDLDEFIYLLKNKPLIYEIY